MCKTSNYNWCHYLFLQREDELLSSWWKECAESSDGPTGTSFLSKSNLQIKVKSPESAADEERVGVPVKGGLYEVSLLFTIFLSVNGLFVKELGRIV